MRKTLYITVCDDFPPLVSDNRMLLAERTKSFCIDILFKEKQWIEDWYDFLTDISAVINFEEFDEWGEEKQDIADIEFIYQWELFGHTIKFFRRVIDFQEENTDTIICA